MSRCKLVKDFWKEMAFFFLMIKIRCPSDDCLIGRPMIAPDVRSLHHLIWLFNSSIILISFIIFVAGMICLHS